MSADPAGAPETETRDVTFAEALSVWVRIGLLSFGGPAGQIALMHRFLVEERRWLSEERFLHALNFCMLLPGPEAMQLATYVGWLLRGWRGGLAAGLLFVLPGALVVFALSAVYALYGSVPLVAALFLGIKAAVLAIVLQALVRIARRALARWSDWAIAGTAFAAIFFLAAPFPLIVLSAALIGLLRARGTAAASAASAAATVSLRQTLATALLWLGIWLAPLGAVTATLGPDHVLSKVGWFFSVLAVVTFGGAYAVLAYMAQQAVETYAWLAPGQMLDGLGLAETTPGPLILVTEFVGFQAGFQAGGEAPLVLATLAALVALWATFAPCFLWIFVGAPHVERLRGRPRVTGALAAITAAVVGVIGYLAVWFALHTLFAELDEAWFGPLRLFLPVVESLDWVTLALSAVSVVALFRFRLGILRTLALCGGLGLLAGLS